MKKAVALLMALATVLSLSIFPAAAAGTSNRGHKFPEKEPQTQVSLDAQESPADSEDSEDTAAVPGHKATMKKQFRTQMNEKKKALQREKAAFSSEKEALEAQYQELMATGDTEGAAAVLEQLQTLDEQMQGLQSQIKEAINQRHMIVKTMYSEDELAQFDSAADLIEQMYEDASVLGAGCVTVHNNIVKFDTPPYVKSGVTIVPLRAISEELGADVEWDGETQTVTVSKGGTVIEIAANSTTVLINGTPAEMTSPSSVTCGRTYVPLRFLAEALQFDVSWDGDNEIIDVDDGTDADTTADTDTDADSDTTDGASTENTSAVSD